MVGVGHDRAWNWAGWCSTIVDDVGQRLGGRRRARYRMQRRSQVHPIERFDRPLVVEPNQEGCDR
jgi:hypothetical protein